MSDIGSVALVRGHYHQLLIRVLLDALARQGLTHDSLGAVVGMHQTTVGDILKRNAGTFDLDEADAALRHVGLSLKLFIENPANAVVVEHQAPSKVRARLTETERGMTDEQLKIVLGAARAVRAGARAEKKSARPPAAGRSRVAHKTAGKQRGA